MGSSISSSRHLACTNSLIISGVIWWCFWILQSSFKASLCSELTSFLYLCTKVKKDWCHRTGSSLVSFLNFKKWKTNESITLYGKVYFLSIKILKKMLLAPEYSISAIFNMTAEACITGMEIFAKTLRFRLRHREFSDFWAIKTTQKAFRDTRCQSYPSSFIKSRDILHFWKEKAQSPKWLFKWVWLIY